MKKILLSLLLIISTIKLNANNFYDGSLFIVEEPEKPQLLILSTSESREAAIAMSNWKSKVGFDVTIIEENGLTSNKWHDKVTGTLGRNKSAFILIIGNPSQIPSFECKNAPKPSGDQITPDDVYDTYYVDFYFGCSSLDVNNTGNVLSVGRIPESGYLAKEIVNAIINYEMDPPEDANFYNRIISLANFQDQGKDSIEDQGFVYSSYSVINLLATKYNKKPVCFFNYDRGVYPKKFHHIYGNGADITPDLRKKLKAGDFPVRQIIDSINACASIIMYRGHGSTTGWHNPNFFDNDLSLLNLVNKPKPIVMSMTCSTVNLKNASKSFSHSFLNTLGGIDAFEHNGCLAFIGASNVAYSGFDDWILYGMMGALWPNSEWQFPYGHSYSVNKILKNPDSAKRMGLILNAGRKRMFEYYYPSISDERIMLLMLYNAEIFSLIGDPSMIVYTNPPTKFSKPEVRVDSLDDTHVQVFIKSMEKSDRISVYKTRNDTCQLIKQVYKPTDNELCTIINIDENSNYGFSITSMDKSPYLGTIFVPRDDVYIQNETITDTRTIFANKLIMGSDVISDKPKGNVRIEGASLEVECNEFMIFPGTEIDGETILNVKTP